MLGNKSEVRFLKTSVLRLTLTKCVTMIIMILTEQELSCHLIWHWNVDPFGETSQGGVIQFLRPVGRPYHQNSFVDSAATGLQSVKAGEKLGFEPPRGFVIAVLPGT